MAGKVMVKVRPIRLKRAYTSDTPTSWKHHRPTVLRYKTLALVSKHFITGAAVMRIPAQMSPHEPEIITDPSRMKVNSPKEARFHHCTR